VTIKDSRLTQVGQTTWNEQLLSLGLAMTLIGGPLWFLFWRMAQRRARDNQEEPGDNIRKLYLNFVLLVIALLGITNTGSLLKWLLAGVPQEQFSSSFLAIVIVSGIIWYYHWRVSEREGYPSGEAKTFRRWYVYILAGFGLVWLAVGLVQLIDTAVVSLDVWQDTLVQGKFWNDSAQMSVARILLGGITWYFHWFRMARGDFDSTLRQVYFYLLTISGGAITALVALTIAIYHFFSWVFRGTTISPDTTFQFLGWAVPTFLAGLAIWGYHRRLVEEEAGAVREKRQSAQRGYLYLMSFLGLGTMATGLSLLIGILIGLIVESAGTSLVQTTGWWREQLSLCLALLLVGMPLWLYYWNRILKRVQAGGIEEWRALPRRVFLYVIVGASIVALTAGLVNIIYQILNGALQGDFGFDVLRSSMWSIEILIVASPLLWYHWQLLRTDQLRAGESAAIRHNVTLLLDDRTADLASRLENKLGYKIRVLYQAGQAGIPLTTSDEEIDRIVNEVQDSPINDVMLVVFSGKVVTMPYQDK